jgi:uncharacterized protein GlcG (DUF336 family)
MSISLEQAQAMVAHAIAKSEELGVQVSISVLDAGGNIVAFARMDGAALHTGPIATGKAYGTVFWGRPSAAIREWAETRAVVFDAIKNLGLHTVVPGPGGLPIPDGGAIGVAGAPSGDQDVEIAEVGLRSLTR